MAKVIQLLTDWLVSDQSDLAKPLVRKSLKQNCYMIWNIIAFLPPLNPCGVCFQLESRKKCDKCEFVLCIACAPKLQRPQCPHCQRTETFPESYNLSNNSTSHRRHRRRNAYFFGQWTDNPFGPVLLELRENTGNSRRENLTRENIRSLIYPPAQRRRISTTSFVPEHRRCMRCRALIEPGDICRCYYSPWLVRQHRHSPVWAWRETSRREELELSPLTRPRPSCFCAMRATVGYRCPYGPNCSWMHGFRDSSYLSD